MLHHMMVTNGWRPRFLLRQLSDSNSSVSWIFFCLVVRECDLLPPSAPCQWPLSSASPLSLFSSYCIYSVPHTTRGGGRGEGGRGGGKASSSIFSSPFSFSQHFSYEFKGVTIVPLSSFLAYLPPSPPPSSSFLLLLLLLLFFFFFFFFFFFSFFSKNSTR